MSAAVRTPMTVPGAAFLIALGAILAIAFQSLGQWSGSRVPWGAPGDDYESSLGSPWPRPIFCKMAVVGGGVGGLHFALELLDNGVFKPEDICIFERSLKFAGRADDFYWPDPETGKGIGGDLEPVGLGGWRIDQDNNPRVWKHAVERYNMTLHRWQVATKYREARGQIVPAADTESLRKHYALPESWGNKSIMAEILLKFPPTPEATAGLRNYTDMYDFILGNYGSEGLAYVREVEFGGWTGAMHLVDPRWSLDMLRMWGAGAQPPRHWRPVGGGIGNVPKLMSEELSKRGVAKMTVAMAITSVDRCASGHHVEAAKKQHCYKLRTSRDSVVFAEHVAFAIPPLALAKIKGDVPKDLLKTPLFTQTIPDRAFKAAMLFDHAWWEPRLYANESSGALDGTSGSGNCLGQIVPYKGRGPNGEAALHVSYISGECSDMHWSHMAAADAPHKLTEEQWQAHLLRQMELLFPDTDIPEPLRIVTKFWDEGAWHQQRLTDPYLTSLEILKASTTPLGAKEPVYVINEAFGLRRGWMEASFESAEATVRARFLNMTSVWEEGEFMEKDGYLVNKNSGVQVEGGIHAVVKASPIVDFIPPTVFDELSAAVRATTAQQPPKKLVNQGRQDRQ